MYSKNGASASRLYVESGLGDDVDRVFANWCSTRSPPIATQAQWNTLVNAATLPANNPGVDPRLLQALEFILKNLFRFPADPRPGDP